MVFRREFYSSRWKYTRSLKPCGLGKLHSEPTFFPNHFREGEDIPAAMVAVSAEGVARASGSGWWGTECWLDASGEVWEVWNKK